MSITFTLTPDTSNALVNITVMGLLSTDDTLLVSRNNPDGSVVPCRNANNIVTGGATTMSFVDYEAPLNAPVTYTATGTQHNTDGSITTHTATSPQVTVVFVDQAIWLKSLSQPSLSMEVEIASPPETSRKARQQVNPIIGAKFPVVLSDVSGARSGSMVLTTYTLSDRTALLTLLELGQTVLMQCNSDPNSGDGFEDMYFIVGDIDEIRPGVLSTEPTRQWHLVYNEVDVPSGTITNLPGNSWLIVTNFGTWANVLAQRVSWLDVLNRAYGS